MVIKLHTIYYNWGVNLFVFTVASSRFKEQLIQELEKEHLEENLTQLIALMTGKVDFRGAFNWLFALYEHQGNKLTENDLRLIHQILIELPRKRIRNDLQGNFLFPQNTQSHVFPLTLFNFKDLFGMSFTCNYPSSQRVYQLLLFS